MGLNFSVLSVSLGRKVRSCSRRKLWKLYVNGVQQDLTSTNFVFPQSATYTKNYIGKSNWVGGDAYFKGKMDDFRVYDKALSQTEITDVAVMYNLPLLLCGPDGCYACPVNTYKASLGPETCDACGTEQLAPSASTSPVPTIR